MYFAVLICTHSTGDKQLITDSASRRLALEIAIAIVSNLTFSVDDNIIYYHREKCSTIIEDFKEYIFPQLKEFLLYEKSDMSNENPAQAQGILARP